MSRDLRSYARQTNVRLLIGFMLILLLIGIGSIYTIYGPEAAVMGIICLVFGLTPLIFIWGSLWVISWIVKRANRD